LADFFVATINERNYDRKRTINTKRIIYTPTRSHSYSGAGLAKQKLLMLVVKLEI